MSESDRSAIDDEARRRALDVEHSWLVQAPAGSGKTGLLIQRYLALLPRVDRPERIVAMTFTRKAAAEMRDRVVAAIAHADEAPRPGESTHDARTRDLARAALQRDRELGWNLVDHPARLRIMTIDALSASIARQAPVTAGLGALPAFVDDATALYREAARNALASATGDAPHWSAFLRWLDNNAETTVRLLADMLAARDRWGPALLGNDSVTDLRASLEAQLAHEIGVALGALRGLFPIALAQRLRSLAGSAAEELGAMGADDSLVATLRSIAASGDLPAATTVARAAWEGIAGWVLTRKGEFCKRATIREGFPAAGNSVDKLARAARKAQFERWLEDAARVNGLAAALHGVRGLPPHRMDDEAWRFVEAALRILPQAAGSLLQVFSARGHADFTEATLRALQALGTADDPSELLLALDYRLDHLLVDEFQDTSAAQLKLIERLTAGWQPGDARTLFAVGDPMQSIYRFRQAEVRIFVEAQARERIADIDVGVLRLSRNFRSQPGVIEWVNRVFARVLGSTSNAVRGEVAYEASLAGDPSRSSVEPTLSVVVGRDLEAREVVRRILAARESNCREIAVLLRARSHATLLLPALRDAGIAYAAVELEALNERLATRDLMSLVRALTRPADRLAWLSILRAPWCGLTLADLLPLAEAAQTRTIVEALSDPAVVAQLSQDGRARALRTVSALARPLASRGDATLAQRVRAAWLALGGPACAEEPLDRTGADRLFALLSEYEDAGDLPDFDAFELAAEHLYADADEAQHGVVQVMTLHKAKGLEFDAVILPGLDRPARRDDDVLLRWKVRERDDQPTLLLAPLRAKVGLKSEADPLYRFLREIDQHEEHAELGRLLYVGATRARRELHLIAVGQIDRKNGAPPAWKRPGRGTALERLWDSVVDRVHMPPGDAGGSSIAAAADADDTCDPLAGDAPPARAEPLSRLPADWRFPPLPAEIEQRVVITQDLSDVVFDWADATAAAIGTVTHRLLAQLAREGVDRWSAQRLASLRPRILAELALEQVDKGERDPAAQRVQQAIERTLADARGRWLFAQSHQDARSEWALTGLDGQAVAHIVIDRSFVEDGVRWIVDYKTGRHEGGDVPGFMAREVERYRNQLERYGRIVAGIEARPIRLALYYPLVEGGWREIEAATAEASDRSE